MTPSRRLLIAVIFLLTAAAGGVAGRVYWRPRNPVRQPIAFNHDIHVDGEGLECVECHAFCETGVHAGLPSLGTCLECHEEDELGEFAAKQGAADLEIGEDVSPFHKLFKLPDHVFYTHRRHAGIAQLPCETCHGEIAKTETPPESPLQRISMAFCLDCHRREGVSEDCTRCHH